MAVARRRARRTRKADEFSLSQLSALLTPPTDTSLGIFTWDLPQIRNARDKQLIGEFEHPVRMAAAMKTDDALFTAKQNRLDPQRCIDRMVEPAKDGRAAEADRIALEADALFGSNGVGVTVDTLADLNGTFADHGIAIGYNVPTVRDDGSRVDFEHCSWPLEHVRWDPLKRQLMTRVEVQQNGVAIGSWFDVPIVHGDGRWVVYAKHAWMPWKQEACILPAALIWARHAAAVRDWAKGSTAHGNAKVIGTLPDQMALSNQDGSATKEAKEMMLLLRTVASHDMPIGMKPFGAELEYLTNNSRAWEVWRELVVNAEKSAARVYLGTDGILGAQGGAPGVDIATLFGVATTKVQGDLKCIERAFKTGVLDPWAAINFGDSTLAPTMRYMIPDADADALRESYGKRLAAFNLAIKELRANQFVVDQALVNAIAEGFGIDPPTVADARGEIFQYDLELGIIEINEARERKGFDPRKDGDMTIPERDAALAPAPAPQPAPPPNGSNGTKQTPPPEARASKQP